MTAALVLLVVFGLSCWVVCTMDDANTDLWGDDE